MAELFPLKDNPPEAIAVFEELCEAVRKGEAKLVPLDVDCNGEQRTMSCVVRIGKPVRKGDEAVMSFKSLAMLMLSDMNRVRGDIRLPEDHLFEAKKSESETP